MPIPDDQALMAPILHELSDGHPHPLAEIRNWVARRLKLSDDDLRERVPSGQKPLFYDRVSWAISFMKQAEVLDRPQPACTPCRDAAARCWSGTRIGSTTRSCSGSRNSATS